MKDLHVKYRPQTLDEVVGQAHAVNSVKDLLARYREGKSSARAFLLTGESGCGKTTIARIIAREMGASVNSIFEVDAASHSGVDAMRGLADTAQTGNILAETKAYIVDECHALSANAWQALLKTIEEPPEGVVWLFATTEAGKVPKTIKTRCVSFELRPVDTNSLFEMLVQVARAEGFDTPDPVINLAAEGARGSPRQALVNLSAVAAIKEVGDAAATLRQATPDSETVEFIRLLAGGNNDWGQIMSALARIGDVDAESLRISICGYLAAVIVKTTDTTRACALLSLMECFINPYNRATAKADLLSSIAKVCFTAGD